MEALTFLVFFAFGSAHLVAAHWSDCKSGSYGDRGAMSAVGLIIGVWSVLYWAWNS